MKCKICGNNSQNKIFLAKEMMYGLRDPYTYQECANCGCLQILDPPVNMAKAYPSDYFHRSFKVDWLTRTLVKKRDEYALLQKSIIGKLIASFWPPDALFKFLGSASISRVSRILDVGCGSGSLLAHLREMGFTDLTGIDPYTEVRSDLGVTILRETVEKLPDNETFDFIIANHSLEHMSDQLSALRKVSKLLSEGGMCIVRMPVKTDYFWNRYGVNWLQLDAPRHCLIHTIQSFELLVANSGLTEIGVIFDADWETIAGSEQYMQGVSLMGPDSPGIELKGMLSRKDLRQFKKLSKELNSTKQGDQATFCLVN